MKLRRATREDTLFILGVRNDPVTRAHSRTDLTKDEGWLWARLDDPEHFCFVAEVEDQPVGYGSLQRYTPLTAEVSIALAPEARGRGLARHLIDGLVHEGRKLGINRFLATVKGDNVPSIRAFLTEEFRPSKWLYLERTL